MKKGRVVSINRSSGEKAEKSPVTEAMLIEGQGLEGDIHRSGHSSEVTLLSIESIRELDECPKASGSRPFGSGALSENITTEGLRLSELSAGSRLEIGKQLLLEVTRIGRKCWKYCPVHSEKGNCAVPREAVFSKVLKGGPISVGDPITT